MRSKLTPSTPAAALGRMLDQLERELIEASDEEILEAARDLGMNPLMKGSPAFFGLRVPPQAHFADFFDSEALRSVLLDSAAWARRETAERRIERKDPAED